MRQLCAWSGMPCDCDRFPFLKDGIVPSQCEDKMGDALLGIRKVSQKSKKRYENYLAELSNKASQNGTA